MVDATHDPYADCLSAAWLSARLAVDVVRIDAMRRGGELIAARPDGSTTWVYPAWQFSGGKPRPGVRRIVAAAREAGIGDEQLYERLVAPLGLSGRGAAAGRLADLLADGEDDQVVSALRRR